MVKQKAILVLDNSEDDILLLAHMLQRAGILNPFNAVKTIGDAIAYVNGDGTYSDREKFPEPILIFTDLHLGIDSGFELLDWLRERQRPFGVVVLSGSDAHAINNAYRHGADSFLTKPLNFEDFRHLIRRLRGLTLRSVEGGLVVDFQP